MVTTDAVATWIHQRICGMHGHENFMQFARNRVFLKCISCGFESPGWDVKARPAATESTDAAPRRRAVQVLTSVRRAA